MALRTIKLETGDVITDHHRKFTDMGDKVSYKKSFFSDRLVIEKRHIVLDGYGDTIKEAISSKK